MRYLQAAKECVYATLRDRVRVANPERVATIAGVERTAVAMEGALMADADRDLAGVFYVSFPGLVVPTTGPVTMECAVRYSVLASKVGATDWEQAMSAMDEELLAACPAAVSLVQQGVGAVTPVLGATATWAYPVFGAVKKDGARWRRTATLAVSVAVANPA